MKKVLTNKTITYFKDSTMIINICYVEEKYIDFIYKILRVFYQNKIIYKIIYEKEFIIAHFNDKIDLSLFSNQKYLLCVNLYYYIKNILGLNIYFYQTIKIDSNEIIIPIVFFAKNKTYLCYFEEKINYEFDETIKQIKILNAFESYNSIDKDYLRLGYSNEHYEIALNDLLNINI